jgi:hypothetical protein
MWFSRRRLAPATVLALLAAMGPGRARAEAVQQAEAVVVPATELRLVGGMGLGAEAAQSLFDHRLRLGAGVHGWRQGVLAEGAALVRVLGSAANGIWLRGGFMYHDAKDDCGVTDRAQAWDAGLAYRKRWTGGSLFAMEAGLETVSRPSSVFCNDSTLRPTSYGARVSVGGQYALTRGLGLHGRFGVRTGEHEREIGLMPEMSFGVAFEF